MHITKIINKFSTIKLCVLLTSSLQVQRHFFFGKFTYKSCIYFYCASTFKSLASSSQPWFQIKLLLALQPKFSLQHVLYENKNGFFPSNEGVQSLFFKFANLSCLLSRRICDSNAYSWLLWERKRDPSIMLCCFLNC